MPQSSKSCRTQGFWREASGSGISDKRKEVSGHHSRGLGRGPHLIKGLRGDTIAAEVRRSVLKPPDVEMVQVGVRMGGRKVGMRKVLLFLY